MKEILAVYNSDEWGQVKIVVDGQYRDKSVALRLWSIAPEEPITTLTFNVNSGILADGRFIINPYNQNLPIVLELLVKRIFLYSGETIEYGDSGYPIMELNKDSEYVQRM